MAPDAPVRSYVVLAATPALVQSFRARGREGLIEYIDRLVTKGAGRDRRATPDGFEREVGPDLGVASERLQAEGIFVFPGGLNVTLDLDRRRWRELRAMADDGGDVLGVGIDLPIAAARHWSGGPFADRTAAERLHGIEALRADGTMTGANVAVALFDGGVDAARIPGRYGGGFGPKAGSTVGGHGMLTLRHVQSVAPDATIFDAPVLPPRLVDVPGFLSRVDAAYRRLLFAVAQERRTGVRRPWVAVNAWAVFDSRRGTPADDDLNDPAHPLNAVLTRAASRGVDLVFAAGNCGQFSPDARCGESNREPGASILGPNSHPDVLTVGAVRSDGLWSGGSSQGPGQPRLAEPKPDLCAASEFRETEDSAVVYTGTSTASALAAGIVAALRSRWRDLDPATLRQVLRETARPSEGAGWRPRTGFGVLDAVAAVEALSETA